jgi:hypothetical protein
MSSTTTSTTVSSPVSIGNRGRLALVGVLGAAALASGVVLAVDSDDPASAPTSVDQSQSVPNASQAIYERRPTELSQSTLGATQSVDPRPEIDQRQAADQFHYRLEPVASGARGTDSRPEINQRRAAERFHHR